MHLHELLALVIEVAVVLSVPLHSSTGTYVTISDVNAGRNSSLRCNRSAAPCPNLLYQPFDWLLSGLCRALASGVQQLFVP